MNTITEQFFKALWEPGMKSVYTKAVPPEMMLSAVNEGGWYEWKLVPGTLMPTDYWAIEKRFDIKFPASFIDWHRAYFFADGDCSLVRLPESLPTEPLQEIEMYLTEGPAEDLLPLGLIPFADDGNGAGLLVFDTRGATNKEDYPIRIYDHEYDGDLEGLGEIIFSSFSKMLECLTHYLNAERLGQDSQALLDFSQIDPECAVMRKRELKERLQHLKSIRKPKE
jgi:hypothetical protein